MVSTNSTLNRTNGFHWLDADAYLFDIDGTLLNTRDLVHWNALHQAMLDAYGIDATIAGIQYHGKTDLGILRAAMTRAGVDRDKFEAGLPLALEVVRREVAANAAAMKPEVCAAIPDMLSRLQSGGKLLGVASGNLEAVGWQKIAAAGMKEFFSFRLLQRSLRDAGRNLSQRGERSGPKTRWPLHNLLHRRHSR